MVERIIESYNHRKSRVESGLYIIRIDKNKELVIIVSPASLVEIDKEIMAKGFILWQFEFKMIEKKVK